MTEATNRPMRQTSPMNWLAGRDFDFAEFAAFLRRHDPDWLIQCASRSAHTPGTVDRNDCESGDIAVDEVAQARVQLGRRETELARRTSNEAGSQ